MKIFDSDPAAYPESNIPERDAVSIFQYIINRKYLKEEIKVLDKVPNIDGIIEVTNDKQVPLGKVEVQIKKLSEKNLKKPKYQCDEKFLSYCELSILPVLLIVVDVKNEIAYWHHLDKNTLKELSKKKKGKSVSLDISIKNSITKEEEKYIGEWIEIIKNYRKRILFFDKIEEELHIANMNQDELLKKLDSNSLIELSKEDIIDIQFFLDYYNQELNGRFKIVKDIYYKDVWKIGFAYLSYSPNNFQFSLFTIKYGRNESQIKKFKNDDDFFASRENSALIGYYNDNPIKENIRNFSNELILEKLLKIIDKQLISLKNEHLANEYVYVFANKFYAVLGLKNESQYSIEEIRYGLDIYLNMFIDELGYDDSIFPFNIDDFNWRMLEDEIENVKKKVENKFIQNISNPQKKYTLKSNHYSLTYLYQQIEYLEYLNIKHVKSILPKKKYPKKKSYFKWEVYDMLDFKESIKSFYNIFPQIYDDCVDAYFPLIKNELKYFNRFNEELVVLTENELNGEPILDHYCIVNINNSINTVEVFLNGENDFSLNRKDIVFNENKDCVEIEYNNVKYKLVKGLHHGVMYILDEFPLHEQLYKLLKERLTSYLEKK